MTSICPTTIHSTPPGAVIAYPLNHLKKHRFNEACSRATSTTIYSSKKVKDKVFLARMKERKQLGFELHDNINQLLACAKLTVEALDLNGYNLQLRKKAADCLNSAIDEIRYLTHQMVSQSTNERNFLEEVKDLVHAMTASNQLKAVVSEDGCSQHLKPMIRKTIYRIIQEQTNNIIKHSKANCINVNLMHSANRLLLMISDNGVGFDPTSASTGIGLRSIAERAKLLHGTAEINSTTGSGCTLRVIIPTKKAS